MTEPRRVFTSEAKFDFPGLRFITVTSPHLHGRGDIIVFTPPGIENLADLPLTILLHGVGSSHWAWVLNAGVDRTAREMMLSGEIAPMVLAMPSDGLWGEGSGYLPHDHADYERWIIDDVVEVVREVVPQTGATAPLFLTGFSMGGYGALRLGARYPDRVRAVSGHASITEFDQIPPFFQTAVNEFRLRPGTALSVLALMLRNRAKLPAIRFDVPLQDDLLTPNRELHRQLDEHGIKHIYEECEGIHEWDYCERQVRETLRFFDRNRGSGKGGK